MPFDLLGKVFFPRLQPWERRRKIKVVLGVLFTAILMAGFVGMMIYKQNFARH